MKIHKLHRDTIGHIQSRRKESQRFMRELKVLIWLAVWARNCCLPLVCNLPMLRPGKTSPWSQRLKLCRFFIKYNTASILHLETPAYMQERVLGCQIKDRRRNVYLFIFLTARPLVASMFVFLVDRANKHHHHIASLEVRHFSSYTGRDWDRSIDSSWTRLRPAFLCVSIQLELCKRAMPVRNVCSVESTIKTQEAIQLQQYI